MKAKLCEFGDQEDLMIRDKIVFSVNDERVKERLLRESDLSLSKALDVCRAAETTRAQLKAMTSEGKSEAKVNIVKQRSQFSKDSHRAGGRGNRGSSSSRGKPEPPSGGSWDTGALGPSAMMRPNVCQLGGAGSPNAFWQPYITNWPKSRYIGRRLHP